MRPCPWCQDGGKPITFQTFKGFRVGCLSCEACGPWKPTSLSAESAWDDWGVQLVAVLEHVMVHHTTDQKLVQLVEKAARKAQEKSNDLYRGAYEA